MLEVCALAIVSLCFILLLKKLRPEFTFFIQLTFLCFIAFWLLHTASGTVETLLYIGNEIGLESNVLNIIFKSLLIAVLSQITANICKDNGESALSTGIETAGRLCILIFAMPLAMQIFELTLGWMKL